MQKGLVWVQVFLFLPWTDTWYFIASQAQEVKQMELGVAYQKDLDV